MSDAVANHETLPRVLVMMATYNGERYVAEQIDSILVQEGVAVFLLISDDGSSDGTCGICEEYAKRCDNVTFRQNEENKGLAKNFMDMVYEVDVRAYDYFAFSDQDDYWIPAKLEHAIACLREGGEGDSAPALYYSDVLNVDKNLENPKPEYRPFGKLSKNLKTLLLCNWASGCTMVFNRRMCELARKHPVGDFPRIHDTWLHLVAMTCGRVCPDLDNAYIYRRITGENQVGERDFGDYSISRVSRLARGLRKESEHELTKSAQQLFSAYSQEMSKSMASILKGFCSMNDDLSSRFRVACDRGYRLPSSFDTLIVKMRVLSGRC